MRHDRMMWPLLLIFTALAPVLGQETRDTNSDAEQMVAALGNVETRAEAHEQILGADPRRVAPALVRAAGGDDAETAKAAQSVLRQMRLGITDRTPAEVRELATRFMEARATDDAEAREDHVDMLRQLAKSGRPGLRVLRYLSWCHGVSADGATEQILNGSLRRAVRRGWSDRLLTHAACRTRSEKQFDADSYVGTCLAFGRIDEGLAHVLEWHALTDDFDAAYLASRLHWAAGRRGQATQWAAISLEDGELEAVASRLHYLIAVDALDVVADYCERHAKEVDTSEGLSQLYIQLRGTAALCAHLRGDREKRDANIDALLRAEQNEEMPEDEQRKHSSLKDATPRIIMLLCELADSPKYMAAEGNGARANDSAPEEEEPRGPAWTREWRPRAPIRVPTDLDECVKHIEALRALDREDEARKVLRLAPHLIRYRIYGTGVGEIYEHALALEEAGIRKKLEALLLDPDSPHFSPYSVISAHTHNASTASDLLDALMVIRPDADVPACVRLSVAIASGTAPREQMLETVREVGTYARRHPLVRLIDPDDEEKYGPKPLYETMELLAEICLQYNLIEEAADYCLAGAKQPHGSKRMAANAGRLLAGAGKWDRARDAFQQYLELTDRPKGLYYLGWATSKGGDHLAGKRRKHHAITWALAQGRTMLKATFPTRNLDEFMAQLDLLYRLDPLYWGSLIYMAPLPYELTGEYRRAYDWRRSQVLGSVLRDRLVCPASYASYLNIDHALARLKMGEEVDIEAVCDRFIEQRPEDAEGAILLVRALEELGRKDLADRVYAATMEIKREELEWGRRNSFAWVAGMCGRDLDEALDAAEGNTGLLFGPAAYLDTLAAVYYARGEYRKAVETEARAVAEGRSMTPLLWPFQLARFSAALKASTAD